IESDVREEDAPADLRTQEMAARMKAAAQAAAPQAPPPANVQTEARAPVQPAAPAFRPAAPQQAPVQHHAPAQPAMRDPGVTIAPLAPPPVSFDEAELDHEFGMVPAPVREEHVPAPQPFIPPAAEAPAAARMPRVEDFPVVAQREMQAQRADAQPQHDEDRGPMSLLRRLA